MKKQEAAGQTKKLTNLQKGFIWSEILGKPVSRTRRERSYGNQGNAHR